MFEISKIMRYPLGCRSTSKMVPLHGGGGALGVSTITGTSFGFWTKSDDFGNKIRQQNVTLAFSPETHYSCIWHFIGYHRMVVVIDFVLTLMDWQSFICEESCLTASHVCYMFDFLFISMNWSGIHPEVSRRGLGVSKCMGMTWLLVDCTLSKVPSTRP